MATHAKPAAAPAPSTAGPSDAAVARAEIVGGAADAASTAADAIKQLADHADIGASTAASLTALLQSSDASPALGILAQLTGGAGTALTTIAPAAAIVAPALVFLGAILDQVSKAAANPGLAAALAKRAAALQPVLRAAAKSPAMARDHEKTLVEMTAVLKTASEAVGRVTKRGYATAFFMASSDKAAIDGAEAAVDKWVGVLTSAVVVAQGGDAAAQAAGLKALMEESAAAAAATEAAAAARHGELMVVLGEQGAALQHAEAMVRGGVSGARD